MNSCETFSSYFLNWTIVLINVATAVAAMTTGGHLLQVSRDFYSANMIISEMQKLVLPNSDLPTRQDYQSVNTLHEMFVIFGVYLIISATVLLMNALDLTLTMTKPLRSFRLTNWHITKLEDEIRSIT